MNTALPYSSSSAQPMGWLYRAESWLDSKGKGAWIAAMVLGFIFFWPVGLALLPQPHQYSPPVDCHVLVGQQRL